MPHLLLTGAGFSHNWGGWLADEVFDYPLSSPKLTPELREEIWCSKISKLGFEDTLRRLRETATPVATDLRKRLESIILDMFADMESAFTKSYFEFTQATQAIGQRPLVRDLLSRFDAIFTLNQDTLLERRYERPSGGGKWRFVHRPGLNPINNRLFRPATIPYTIPRDHQPYFKLHGSCDWRFNDSALLIMGGSKGKDIDAVPLLSAYREEFRARACRSDSRVMIIGYGFRDEHINEILIKACAAGAGLYLVDLKGVDVLDAELMSKLYKSIIGNSSRPLTTTLHNDIGEHQKLMKFFS